MLEFVNSKIGDRLIKIFLLPPMELLGSYMLWSDDNEIRKAMGVTWKEFHAKQAQAEKARLNAG